MASHSLGGAFEEFTVGDRTIRVRELTMGEYNDLQKFLNRQPRPKGVDPDYAGPLGAVAETVRAALEDVTLEEGAKQKALAQLTRDCLRVAAEQMREARFEAGFWPPEVGTPEGGRVLLTADGGKATLLRVALNQDGSASQADAEALLNQMRPADFYQVVAVLFGGGNAVEADGEAEGGDTDPKA